VVLGCQRKWEGVVADRWASDEQESNLKMEFNSLIRLKFDSAQMMPSQT
jgi:hypothetical protein